jgi:V/A-type H+-transporting ATPase subunit C
MVLEELAELARPYTWYIVGVGSAAALAVVAWRMRWLGSVIRFAYPNATYNTQGNRFVTQHDLETLVASNSLPEVLSLIHIKEVNLKDIRDYSTFETVYNRYHRKRMEGFVENVPKDIRPVVEAYLAKYELEVIKTYFKAYHTGKLDEVKDVVKPWGNIDSHILYNITDAKDIEEAADALYYTPYGKAVKQAVDEFNGDLEYFDSVLDLFYLKNLKESAEKTHWNIKLSAREFVDVILDTYYLKLLTRLRSRAEMPKEFQKLLDQIVPTRTLHGPFLQALWDCEDVPTMVALLQNTPYGEVLNKGLKQYQENGDLSGFEIELDRFLLNRSVKYGIKNTLTAGPVMRYMISKEFEVRNIKVVARGVYEQLHTQRINSMLVWEVGQL